MLKVHQSTQLIDLFNLHLLLAISTYDQYFYEWVTLNAMVCLCGCCQFIYSCVKLNAGISASLGGLFLHMSLSLVAKLSHRPRDHLSCVFQIRNAVDQYNYGTIWPFHPGTPIMPHES